MEFFRIEKDIPFMRHALVFNVISGVTFILAVFFLLTRGLHLGVEFTGGMVMEVAYSHSVELDKVRTTLEKLGLRDATVQSFGNSQSALIRLPARQDQSGAKLSEDVFSALQKDDPSVQKRRVDFVGSQVGKELVQNGAWALGLDWGGIRAALETQFLDALTLVTSGSVLSPDQLEQLRGTMRTMASVYPGVAILGAIAGGALASALAWYITDGRAGQQPRPFGEIRFNDHMIWGAIVTLALVMLPLPAPFAEFAANALVVWAGLYMARGAAVVGHMAGRWPLPLRISLALAAVLLLPYALGGLLLLGLADTWLDFRRADPPPTQGAFHD